MSCPYCVTDSETDDEYPLSVQLTNRNAIKPERSLLGMSLLGMSILII